MWGGWEGHQPELFVEQVKNWLENEDIDYVVSNDLNDYANFEFFRTRIPYEEYYLIKFFEREYVEYRKKVGIGIPVMEYFVLKKLNEYGFQEN